MQQINPQGQHRANMDVFQQIYPYMCYIANFTHVAGHIVNVKVCHPCTAHRYDSLTVFPHGHCDNPSEGKSYPYWWNKCYVPQASTLTKKLSNQSCLRKASYSAAVLEANPSTTYLHHTHIRHRTFPLSVITAIHTLVQLRRIPWLFWSVSLRPVPGTMSDFLSEIVPAVTLYRSYPHIATL